MKKQKNLKISILGHSFFITTDEDTDDILQAAEMVSDLMKEKIEKNPSGKEGSLALITALQIATDYKKNLREIDEYKKTTSQLSSLLES